MSYSLKQLPNKPYEFPAPPVWAVWVEERTWDYSKGTYAKRVGPSTGQIRHMPNLTKARKRVMDYARIDGEKFVLDWAVYKWDGTEYVLQFEGFTGEKRASNPLFQTAPKDLGEIEDIERPGFEEELEAALRSIASVHETIT